MNPKYLHPRARIVGPFYLALVAMAFIVLTCSARSHAAIMAVGDERDVWLVLTEDDRSLSVLHRAWDDDAHTLTPVVKLSGKLTANGIAASDRHLWLIYDNMTVQSIERRDDVEPGMPRYDRPSMEPPLPRVASIEAFAAVGDQPWALVRVESADVLSQIDATTQPAEEAATQPDLSTSAATQPATTQPALRASSPAQSVKALRLLRLDRTRWIHVDMPASWPQDGRMFLVADGVRGTPPSLLRIESNAKGSVLHLARLRDGEWTTHAIPLEGAIDGPIVTLLGQIVLARSLGEEGGNRKFELWGIHDVKAIRLGDVAVPGIDKSWTMATVGQTVALVTGDKVSDLNWVRADLTGHVTAPAEKLVVASPNVALDVLGISIQMILLGFALLMMFVVWKRDAGKINVAMPNGYVEADFLRRLAAGAIDLIPCVIAVWLILHAHPADVLKHWPGRPIPFPGQLPGAVLIGLFVLHTFFSELFTATTLGKRMVGLTVISTNGKPPHVWQVAARCLLKAFELVAWPLLIFPLIRPFAQRLGDSVARTVVVMPRPEVSPDDEM